MQRIEDSRLGEKELAIKTLTWLFRAQRTLSMSELLEVLEVEEGDEELTRDNSLEPSKIVECCKSLVVYDEDSKLIRFAHYTVEEFIANRLEDKLPAKELAITCLTYLSFLEFEKPYDGFAWKRMETYKFSGYAAEFWGFHARQCETDPQVQEAIQSFLASKNKVYSMIQMQNSIRMSSKLTVLHIAAMNGLAETCRFILDLWQRREHHAYSLFLYSY
jgi:hypothetical protein